MSKLTHRLIKPTDIDGDTLPDWFAYLWENGQVDGTQHIVLIDSQADCGMTFPGIALVFDLDNPNPAVCLRQPTTIGLLRSVGDYIKERLGGSWS